MHGAGLDSSDVIIPAKPTVLHLVQQEPVHLNLGFSISQPMDFAGIANRIPCSGHYWFEQVRIPLSIQEGQVRHQPLKDYPYQMK